MTEIAFVHGRVVLPGEIAETEVTVAGGVVAAVGRSPGRAEEIVDLAGDYLLPGLVELHTDNLEKHFEPRPGVFWPSPLAALLAHDGQVAAAGITTVLDAVCIGDLDSDGTRAAMLERSIAALREARGTDILRADHLLHLRCELADPGLGETFERFVDEPGLRLISVMDHTPGQRQWTDIAVFAQYHRDAGWSPAELDAQVALRRSLMADNSARHRAQIVARGRAAGIPLASHDDTTPEHVVEALAEGIAIAEFPTTRLAAELARAQGMAVIMGAPNLVRGGSHSGNVATAELAAAGLVDALSSDYVPASLLHAAFLLHGRHGLALADAVALVSRRPAAMIGLSDRGAVAEGLRADLIRVRLLGEVPVVRGAWRQGRRIL